MGCLRVDSLVCAWLLSCFLSSGFSGSGKGTTRDLSARLFFRPRLRPPRCSPVSTSAKAIMCSLKWHQTRSVRVSPAPARPLSSAPCCSTPASSILPVPLCKITYRTCGAYSAEECQLMEPTVPACDACMVRILAHCHGTDSTSRHQTKSCKVITPWKRRARISTLALLPCLD